MDSPPLNLHAPVVVCADDDDSDLASQSSAASRTLVAANSADMALTSRFMSVLCGDPTGAGMPAFTLVATAPELPASPRETNSPILMVAGEVDASTTATVWHEIASGSSLLPAVRVDFGDPHTQCFWCEARSRHGVPVLHLKHVATFAGDDQRIQLSVRLSCQRCTQKRVPASAMRSEPLRSCTFIYARDQFTLHLQYVVMRLREMFVKLRVTSDEAGLGCDKCHRQLSSGSPPFLVMARRHDSSELAVLFACSAEHREELIVRLRSVVDRSREMPRPLKPTDRLEQPWQFDDEARKRMAATTRWKPHERSAVSTSRCVDESEIAVEQWQVLTPEEATQLMQDGSVAGLQMGRKGNAPLVHNCTGPGCFCVSTYRHTMRLQKCKTVRGSGETEVVAHYALERIFRELRSVHLYTTILSDNASTQCAGCGRPTTALCTVCKAFRLCAQCSQRPNPMHKRLCRPYAECTWTAPVFV